MGNMTALVTGANRGLGLESSRQLLANGLTSFSQGGTPTRSNARPSAWIIPTTG